MQSSYLLVPMLFQVALCVILYGLLTLARAPKVWATTVVFTANYWQLIEPKISANLRNQFEWPILFFTVCVLQFVLEMPIDSIQIAFAWLFVLGRWLHSAIHIFTFNVRLRGLIFTINFLAVLAMWITLAVYVFKM